MGESGDQNFQAATKITKRRTRAALSTLLYLSANDAAVPLFELTQRGERARKTELFGVAGPDSGYEWADEIREQVRPKFSPDKGGNRFVCVGRPRVPKRLGEDA